SELTKNLHKGYAVSENKRVRLNLEVLEDRITPAGYGVAWVNSNLTLSFAPDGTDVGGAASNLVSTLDTTMSQATWESTILRAFDTWATAANLNVGLVSDNGTAFGTPGSLQGSNVVGDIRIGARALSNNEVAISNPYDMLNTWSGKTIFNSNKSF